MPGSAGCAISDSDPDAQSQLKGVKIDFAWSGLMSYARYRMPQLGTAGDGLW